jgi:hypothetical protein
MARARTTVETSDDILFINRPLPPENSDLFLYIEDQITELLLPDETLADTIYRFGETGGDIVIAVARKKAIAQKPLAARGNSVRCRIPSAIDLWAGVKGTLPADQPSLLSGTYGDHAYLVYADARQVRRVFQFRAREDHDRDLLLAVIKLQQLYPQRGVTLKMHSREKLSEPVLTELRRRSISVADLPGKGYIDAATIEQWDFRLDSEMHEQDLLRAKRRTLSAALISIAAVAALWLLLAGVRVLLERSEQRSLAKWQGIRGSLKEIAYLQKQIRLSITEIMLCKTLSEKRTGRAGILEKIAATRPSELKLEQITIGERRKRMEKGGTAVQGEDAVVLKGYSASGTLITEWMDLLLKSKAFSGVTMVSMDKKEGMYRFQIECTIR